MAQRRRKHDPYAIAQAKARKAANLSRQEVLKKERAATLGDPVRGVTTPFVESFDTALPPEPSPASASTKTRIDKSPVDEAPGPRAERDEHLNFFLSKKELESGIRRSKWLTQPLPVNDEAGNDSSNNKPAPTAAPESSSPLDASDDPSPNAIQALLQRSTPKEQTSELDYSARDFSSGSTPEERARLLREEHERAQEALRRISSLSLGNSNDRLRVNIRRCVDEFGRHNTDYELPPRPASASAGDQPTKFPRVGSDTGSSEVQIAILTAKIRTLADYLEVRGTPGDKVNKRNLRLLVHRRAKLLKYLRRKERGGPRWQNLVEKLGLTDGTWKGEISL